MKRLLFIFIFITTIAFCAFPQSLIELIDLHFDAVKQDQMNKIQSMLIKSELITMNGKIPVTTYLKRPNMLRVETVEDGKKKITAYDGKTGWCVDPGATGITPKELTGAKLDETKFLADMDGYFFCYKEKHREVTLEGKEKILNKDAFKIKCKISPIDSQYVFLDAKNFLIVKVVKPDAIKGDKETYLSDYRKVNGANLPFKFEINEPHSRTFQIIKSIETGIDLPDSIFTMPK